MTWTSARSPVLRPEDLESAGLTPGTCVGGPLDGDPLVARAADDVRGLWALGPGRCFLLAPLTDWPADGEARRLGLYGFEPDRRTWTWIADD
jgi:hypothetical protein